MLLSSRPRALSLTHVLDEAIEATHADFGNVQLVRPLDGALWLVAQRGFDSSFIKFFYLVRNDRSACSAALTAASRIVVPDVRTSPYFTEGARQAVLAAHVRAVQSTPLVSPAGRVLGMISTHFRLPCEPTATQLQRLDMLAEKLAALVQPHDRSGSAFDEPLFADRHERIRRLRYQSRALRDQSQTIVGVAHTTAVRCQEIIARSTDHSAAWTRRRRPRD